VWSGHVWSKWDGGIFVICGGGVCVCVRFVFACGCVLCNRVSICVVLVRLCKGDYVNCVMMVSKILFVGTTVRLSFKWLPLRASLYIWNLSIVFKCLPFF